MTNKIKLTMIGIGVLILTGCNKSIVDTTFSYNKAVCYYGNKEKIINISSWKDYDGEQIQIKDKNGNVYLISSVSCYLTKGE